MSPRIASLVFLLSLSTSLGQSIRELSGHGGPVNSVAYRADGRMFASACHDHKVRVWNTATGELEMVHSGHHGKVTAVAYRSDGMLASVGLDRTLRLWTDGAERILPLEERCVQAIAFTPEGDQLICAGESGMVHIFDLKMYRLERSLPVSEKPLFALAVSPDGREFAAAGLEGDVHIFSTHGKRRLTLEARKAVYSLNYSPSGERLACGGEDGSVRLWETAAGRQVACYEQHSGAVYQVAFSADGRRLVSAGVDGQVLFRAAASGLLLHSHRLPGKALCVVIAPDGRQVGAGTSESGCWLMELPRKAH